MPLCESCEQLTVCPLSVRGRIPQAAKSVGQTLRAFQPTIREVVEVSQELKGTLERVSRDGLGRHRGCIALLQHLVQELRPWTPSHVLWLESRTPEDQAACLVRECAALLWMFDEMRFGCAVAGLRAERCCGQPAIFKEQQELCVSTPQLKLQQCLVQTNQECCLACFVRL